MLEPKPVRILAARFFLVDSWHVTHAFKLKPGQFIQGLLAHISPHHWRVYVVTVRAPADSVEPWEHWPRLV